jgi:preprotein translocase subunit SecG
MAFYNLTSDLCPNDNVKVVDTTVSASNATWSSRRKILLWILGWLAAVFVILILVFAIRAKIKQASEEDDDVVSAPAPTPPTPTPAA